MKKLINEVDNVVNEMLDGMVLACPKYVKRLEGLEVLVRAGGSQGKVALVSGGGSGHEPAHGGFVGKGMLDAAVAGAVFTSPTPDQVYEAIKAANGGKGVLLVIKNYTGDVMNFEMAADMAADEGIEVDKVIVADDVAVENSTWTTGRRGIAGTIFVHKCAGACAEMGGSLAQVKAIAEKVIANVRSMGMAIEACTVPAAGKKSFDLAEDEIEIGIGIHGEPGTHREKISTVNEIADQLIAKILGEGIYNAGDERVCDYIEEAYSMSDWGGRRLAFLDGSTDSCFDAPPLQLIDVRRQNHLWEGLLQFRGVAYPFAFPLAGRYNISNVLGAISAFLSLGYDIHRILDSLPKVAQVPGRLEAVEVPNGPHVLVDFAHTPEALENAILAVKDDLGTQGQLWTVFGAGGDRDPSKRPMMGAIAAKHADHVVITSDNPRTEDPLRIIEEISGGVPDESKEKCTVLPDRKDAIFYALQHAKSEDIVLIAGKGHEDYQILGTTKIHFDDREVVRSFAD